jgi:hypothetical protein
MLAAQLESEQAEFDRKKAAAETGRAELRERMKAIADLDAETLEAYDRPPPMLEPDDSNSAKFPQEVGTKGGQLGPGGIGLGGIGLSDSERSGNTRYTNNIALQNMQTGWITKKGGRGTKRTNSLQRPPQPTVTGASVSAPSASTFTFVKPAPRPARRSRSSSKRKPRDSASRTPTPAPPVETRRPSQDDLGPPLPTPRARQPSLTVSDTTVQQTASAPTIRTPPVAMPSPVKPWVSAPSTSHGGKKSHASRGDKKPASRHAKLSPVSLFPKRKAGDSWTEQLHTAGPTGAQQFDPLNGSTSHATAQRNSRPPPKSVAKPVDGQRRLTRRKVKQRAADLGSTESSTGDVGHLPIDMSRVTNRVVLDTLAPHRIKALADIADRHDELIRNRDPAQDWTKRSVKAQLFTEPPLPLAPCKRQADFYVFREHMLNIPDGCYRLKTTEEAEQAGTRVTISHDIPKPVCAVTGGNVRIPNITEIREWN